MFITLPPLFKRKERKKFSISPCQHHLFRNSLSLFSFARFLTLTTLFLIIFSRAGLMTLILWCAGVKTCQTFLSAKLTPDHRPHLNFHFRNSFSTSTKLCVTIFFNLLPPHSPPIPSLPPKRPPPPCVSWRGTDRHVAIGSVAPQASDSER